MERRRATSDPLSYRFSHYIPRLPTARRDSTMAQKTVTYLVDDLEGGDAEETVKFGLDGTEYEIDLSEKNASALRESLARFVAAGRRAGKAGRAATKGRVPAAT